MPVINNKIKQVKWDGFHVSKSTWEPIENIPVQCIETYERLQCAKKARLQDNSVMFTCALRSCCAIEIQLDQVLYRLL